MWIYGALARLLPESRFKTRIRDFCFGKLLYRITWGSTERLLKDDLRGRFHKLVLIPNNEYSCEINGYEGHYRIKEGDVVIDAGAYLGDFTVYAAKRVGPAGKVVAFEADPYVYHLLLRNIKLNNLTNVIAINKGVWSHDTDLAFDSRGISSQIVTDTKNAGSLIKRIPVVGLDNEMQRIGLPKVDLIKMDIEGAELQAVQGAGKLMEYPNCHFAIASYHIVNGVQTSLTLENLFNDKGWSATTEHPAHLTTYASRKSAYL
jgi:FkbM family methyltransferase